MKELFEITMTLNLDLKLEYISTKENPADEPSRALTTTDCKLSDKLWEIVEKEFGPHSVDLMSLDSNVMSDSEGHPLRHFTPHPSPLSAGVDIFMQKVEQEVNPYVHPPFPVIAPLLQFLEERSVPFCTVILPRANQNPSWWVKVQQFSIRDVVLAREGQQGAIMFPSKHGWLDNRPIPFDLIAYRMCFTPKLVIN
jgi:hypothetical protein